MSEKQEARIRRIVYRGRHAIAFEVKSDTGWKILAKEILVDDYQEDPCIDFLTSHFMSGKYTMMACKHSDHEW